MKNPFYFVAVTARRLLLILTGIAAAFFAGATSASAQSTTTWNQTGTGSGFDWTNDSFWNNTSPYNIDSSGTIANLSSALTSNEVVDLNGTTPLGVLNIGSTVGGFSFSLVPNGANVLDMNNNGAGAQINEISTAFADSISANLVMQDTGGLAISNASAHTFTLSGTITSTASGALTVNSSGSGNTTLSGSISNAGNIFVNANSTGAITLSGSSIANSGNIVLSANSTGVITVSGTSVNNAGTITNQGTGTATDVLSGALGAAVTGVIENSSTSGLTISGANSAWGGTITIDKGYVVLSSTAASGTGTINLGSATGGSAALYSQLGTAVTIGNNITLASGAVGTLILGSGPISGTGSGATLTTTGTITLNGNVLNINDPGTAQFGNNGYSPFVTLNGAIVGGTNSGLNIGVVNGVTAGTGNTAYSAGIVTIGGNNSSYSGTTTLLEGELIIGSTNTALGTGTLVISAGPTGSFANENGFTPTSPILDTTNTAGLTLTLTGETWNSDFIFAGHSTLNLGTGAVSLGSEAIANRSVTVNASTLTVGGVISNGTNSTLATTGLIKNGPGTLVLNGVDTYTGNTIINNGFLSFGSGSTTNTTAGSIVINNGGSLNVTGAFAPASGAAGVLTTGLISAASTGDIAETTNDSNSINFSTGGYNSLMLGASVNSTYSGTITPGSTGYHLGGGGATLTLNQVNALTGSNNLTIGAVSVLGVPVTMLTTSTLGGSSGTIKLSNANNMTGSTAINAGTLDLSSSTNTVFGTLASSPVTVNNGAALAIDWAGGAPAANTNVTRVSSLTLAGGALTDTGTSVSTTDTITGALTLDGGSNMITLTPGTGSAELNAASLTLGTNPSFTFVTGANLGKAAPGTATDGNIIFTTSPGTSLFVGSTNQTTGGNNTNQLNTGIIPYFAGSSSGTNGTLSGTPNTFVTYDTTTGLRPLATGEYATTLVAGDNVAVSATTNTVNTSVNSLIVNTGTLTIQDGTTLTDASGGLILGTTGAATIAPSSSNGTLAFGTATAYINVTANGSTISAPITGSGGLVKTGTGQLSLSTANGNTYTGGTYVLNGTLSLSPPSTTNPGELPFGSTVYLGDTSGSNNTTLRFSGSTSTLVTYANNVIVQGGNTGTATLLIPTNASGSVLTGSITLGSANAAGVVVGHNLTLNPGTTGVTGIGFTGQIVDPAGLTGAPGVVTLIEGNDANFTMVFGNANSTYSGGTVVEYNPAGTTYGYTPEIKLTGGTPFGTGTLTIDGLQLSQSATTTITGTNNQIWNMDWGQNAAQTLNWDMTGTIDLGNIASGTTRTITSGGTMTIFGLINNGSNGITDNLATAGGVVLTTNEAYTGTTIIDSGTLQLGTNSTTGAVGNNTGSSLVDNGTLALDRGDSQNLSTLIGNNGVISGTGGLTQKGSGAVTITTNQTYTGATSVTAGTLSLTGSGALGVGGGTAISVSATGSSSNATLTASGVNAITGTSSLNLGATGTNTVTLSNANNFTGSITMGNDTGDTLILSNSGAIASASSFAVTAGTIELLSNTSATFTTPILPISTNSVTIYVGNNGSGSNNLITFGGGLQGGSSSSREVFVTGANGYGLVVPTVSAGNGFNLLEFDPTTAYMSIGNVTNSNTASGTSSLVLGGTTTTTNTVTGTISNGTGSALTGLTVGGAGFTSTWVVSGSNSFTGATTISSGTLQLGNTYAVQNSTVTLSSSNGLTFSSGIGTFVLGGLTSASNILLADTASSPVTLEVGNNNSSTTYNGVLSGTNGVLVKLGTGDFIVGGASTYTGGTQIQNGAITATNSTLSSGSINIDPTGLNSAALFETVGASNITNSITVSAGSAGGAVIGDNNVNNTSGGYTYSGKITLNRNVSFANDIDGGGGGNYSGSISGIGAVSLIANGGAGEVTGSDPGDAGENITGSSNTYSGGTFVDGGNWSVSNSTILGTSTNIVINGGQLTLNATTNYAAGSSILVNAGGALALNSTSLIATSNQIYSLINANSSGTLNLSQSSGTFSTALNMAALGNGTMFLGGANNPNPTYNASSLGVGAGNTYRLGGGGGTGATTGFTISTPVLVGTAQVVVGSPLGEAPYAEDSRGWVTLTSTNSYTGGTTVNEGSTLVGTAQLSGTPFGSSTNNVTLNGGTLQVNAASTSNTTTGNGALSFNGQAEVVSGAGSSTNNVNTVTFSSLSRGYQGALEVSQGANSLITVASAPSVNNGAIAPYYTDASGNFLTYSPSTGFTDALTVSTTNLIGQTSTSNVLLSGTTTVTTNTTINSLNTAANTLTISAGQVLTVTNGGVTFGITNTASTIGGATGVLNFGTAEGVIGSFKTTGTISAEIEGTGGLTKTGAGAVALSADNSNDTTNATGLSGTVTIDQGILQISQDVSLGDTGNNVLINGGVLNTSMASGTINAARTITIGNNGGTLEDSANSVNTVTIASNISSTNGAPFLDFTDIGGGANTQTTFVLTGTNTFTAPIYLDQQTNGGSGYFGLTLSVGSDSELGNAANSVTLDDQATLEVTGNTSSTRAFNFLNGGGIIDVTNGVTYNLNGVAAGDGNLTKSDLGTLVLGGANSLTGGTLVSGGTLQLTGSLLNTSAVGIGSGATFQLGNGSTSGSLSTSVPIYNAGALILDNSNNFTLGGAISGVGSVTQTGSGIANLTGANTYTGVTSVTNSSTLQLTGGSLGGTAVTVASGSTLSVSNSTTIGTSSLGTLTVATGATLNLQGGGSGNTLSLAKTSGTTLTLGTGSGTITLSFDVGSTSDEISLASGGLASLGSGTTVDVYINGLGGLTGATQTLISAPAGGLGTSGFTLAGTSGTLNGYTLSLQDTGTALNLIETGGVVPTAYWNGSQSAVWNTNNSGLVNWSTAASGGTNTGALPGAVTDVYFATTSPTPTNLTTTLGANFTINSLNFTTSNAVSIGTSSNSLTILALADTTNSNPAGNGISVSSGAGSNSISANVILGTNQTWTNNSANALTVSGNVSDSNDNFALTTAGSGTIVLTGTNTYGGGTTISAGAISINTVANSGSAQSLGTGSNVTFAGGTSSAPAVLQYTGANGALGLNLTVNPGDYGLVDNSGGGVLTLSGGISKNGSVLDLAGGEFVVSGVISGSSNNSDLDLGSTMYPGTATVALDNANTYNGPTYISDGSTLITGTNSALPTSPASAVTLGTNSDTGSSVNTLDLDGNSETVASLNAVIGTNGVINQVISSNATTTGGSIGSGTGDSATTGLLTVNTTTNDPFSGNLGGGASGNNFGLTKSGTGTLTLSGNNTYTGNTTISGGSINVTGTTKNTNTTVATGGLLQGSGTVGAITVQSGATLSPGSGFTLGANLSTSSNNVLTAASLTVSGGATLSYNLYNTTASTGTSANPAGGTLINLGGGAFDSDGSVTTSNEVMLNFNYTASSGDIGRPNVYDLVEFGNPGGTNDMTNLTLGDFSIINLSNVGSTATLNFVYLGGGEEALQLDVIPEPSTWAMFALGLGFLVFAVRRRLRLTRKPALSPIRD